MTLANQLRVLTVGTGAIGAFYSWRLQQSGGCVVTTVCRSNYEVIKVKGIKIQTAAWDEGPHIFRPDHVVNTVPCETFDFIMVCMKALPQVYNIADIIAPAVNASPNAAIVLIQNGIGIEDPIKARFPRNPILSTIAYIGVTQNEAGVVFHSGHLRDLIIGLFEPVKGVDAKSVLQIFGQLCEKADIGTTITDEIQSYRWRKLVWSVSMNLISILSELRTVSNVLASEKYKQLLVTVMEEVVALGSALGYDVPPTLVGQSIATSESLFEGYKASLVVDFEEGRPMETEVIFSNPIKIAEKHQLTHLIPTWYRMHKELFEYLAKHQAERK
ncbi:hypothetical protein BX616_005055 [Lobosporangium transversale]|nr:hypothetical protein BX616_005055 [Lobosporangium transversale]